MQLLSRALDLIGWKGAPESVELHPNYNALMQSALHRVRLAELQIKEATTIEDLDVGRSGLHAAWAEVQQLIRTAKRDRGIPVRSVAETEEMHRRMRDFMNHRTEGAMRKRSGPSRQPGA